MKELTDFFWKNLILNCHATATGFLLESCDRIHQSAKLAIGKFWIPSPIPLIGLLNLSFGDRSDFNLKRHIFSALLG